MTQTRKLSTHSEPIDEKSRHANFMVLVVADKNTEYKNANDFFKKIERKSEKNMDLVGIEPGTSGSKSCVLLLSYRYLIEIKAH